jgi:rhodanese-related sulfurtransferase/ubiquitin
MNNAQDDLKNAKDNIQESAQAAKDNIQQNIQSAKDKLPDVQESIQTAKDKLPDVQESIQTAKDKLPNITPTPPGLKAQSSAHELKARLEWGEPAFTIVDVCDRNVFNDGHIMGAIHIPMDELVDRAQSSLEPSRDIYVYGETDQETNLAAARLREAGFQRVAELGGGLAAWKEIAGPTEGISEAQAPVGPEAYNVISQLQHHTETQQSGR